MATGAEGLKDALKGKLITDVDLEDGCVILRLGRDESVVALQPIIVGGLPAFGYSTAELVASTLQ